MSNKEKRCGSYTGVSCIDGSCPIANRQDYEEYGIPVVRSCDECHRYMGCDDCYWCEDDGGCRLDQEVDHGEDD